MDIIEVSNKAVLRAAKVIKAGGVVIFPTDTVYGFLADATNKRAVEKLFKIKKRAKTKTLGIFVKNIKMANDLAKVSNKNIGIIKRKWPGKFTFIFETKETANSSALSKYCLNKKTIAIRIPKYKHLNLLLKKINKPIAQTSVNISGEEILTKPKEIINKFNKLNKLLFINAGNFKKNKPSKIIDLTSENLTRLR